MTLVPMTTIPPTPDHHAESVSPSPWRSASPAAQTSTPVVNFKRPTSKKFSWEELAQLIANNEQNSMARSEEVQTAYERAVKQRTHRYGSVDNFLRQQVLHWPPPTQDFPSLRSNNKPLSPPSSDDDDAWDSESCPSPPSPTEPQNPLEIVLKKNEFPYSVQDGIEHWLIWSRYPLRDEHWIRRYLEERLPGREYLFFVNSADQRSIKSIFHIQVFTKGLGPVLDEDDIQQRLASIENSR
ncbi:hypothetical protein BGZ73_000611 [Actinomortierella ambigua]|nr:hypothetical protein BGZ73_000611 [Actinomortierella ambigua]